MTLPLDQSWAHVLLLWHVATSAAGFLLVALDKFQARRGGERLPESRLCLVALLGGWPGVVVAMLWLRHKTAKGSFQIKFVATVLLWAAAIAAIVLIARR